MPNKKEIQELNQLLGDFSNDVCDLIGEVRAKALNIGCAPGKGVSSAFIAELHTKINIALIAPGLGSIDHMREAVKVSTGNTVQAEAMAVVVMSEVYDTMQTRLMPELLGDKVTRGVAAAMVKNMKEKEATQELRAKILGANTSAASKEVVSKIMDALRKAH